ncbi:MAG: polysaccharide deacetylase family protein [Candidatus Riflebacteria bacterium]|nr:polysaccharide deacetylase family protein [Candidatus Riflebacteria bacterium]
MLQSVPTIRSVVKTGLLAVLNAIGRPDPDRLPALMYHRLGTGGGLLHVSPEAFEAQMSWLASAGYRTAGSQTLEAHFAGLPVHGTNVVLTFDDGSDDFADLAMPVLERHGFKAIVFAVTGWVDGRLQMTSSPGVSPARSLSWEALGGVLRAGHEVGSHTVSHADLRSLDDAQLARELSDSRAALEDRLQVRIRLLAYPRGKYDARTLQAARAAGYEAAFTTLDGHVRPDDPPFELRRVPVYPDTSMTAFRQRLGPAMDWWGRWRNPSLRGVTP